MQKHRSRGRFLASTAALTASPFALQPARVFAQSPRPLIPLSVNITVSVDLLPFHYAVRQELFAKAGLDVQFTVVSSGSLAMVAVVGGATQIGWGGVMSILTAYSKGIPVQLIVPGGEYVSTLPQTEMFVRADSPMKTPKDLIGAAVAIPALHDQSFIGIRAWVDAAGADSTQIRFVEVPPNSMLAALDAKRVDAIILFEPLRSEALNTPGARSFGRPFDAISRRFLSGAYFANKAWIAQNRDTVTRFATVMRQSAEYVNAHFDELIPIVTTFTKIAPEVIQRSNRLHWAPTLTPAGIQPLIDVAAKYKELPAAFPAQDIIYSTTR
jgi:NitT/TauT family transport system substrate-binding protein